MISGRRCSTPFAGAGRKIEIEMHAKGINQTMIDMAVKTGMPVKAGPKYSAEHQSLGYHQADIRPLEIPTPGRHATAACSPSPMAHGASPAMAMPIFIRRAASSACSIGCGRAPSAICSRAIRPWRRRWRARAISAAPTDWRSGAAHLQGPRRLRPSRRAQRLSRREAQSAGRRLRQIRDQLPAMGPPALQSRPRRPMPGGAAEAPKLGAGADAAQDALAYASRILALLTSAHLPSASNHALWYEMHWNMPHRCRRRTPYSDTPQPHVFGIASPLDPQTFSRSGNMSTMCWRTGPTANIRRPKWRPGSSS